MVEEQQDLFAEIMPPVKPKHVERLQQVQEGLPQRRGPGWGRGVEASGQGEAVAQARAGVFPGVAAVAAEPDAALERAGDVVPPGLRSGQHQAALGRVG